MKLAPRMICLSLAGMLALASNSALGQDAAEQPAGKEVAATAKAETDSSRIKIFKLKHRQLTDVMLFVNLLSPRGAKPPVRVAIDEDTKNIFLRGQGDFIDRVEKIVAAIDVPAAEIGKASLPGLLIVSVSGDVSRQERILEIMNELGIEPKSVKWENTHLLILRAEDEENADIEQVLATLAADSKERAAAE